MRRIEDVIDSIKCGCKLTINKCRSQQTISSYASCLTIYDGTILKDVKEVELGSFLENMPNIKSQLDNGYIYQLNYLIEKGEYQSKIIRYVREGGYKEPSKIETVNNLQVTSENFLTSIIELDTKIAQVNNNENDKVKEKVIA